jgi:hypothetical protein
MRGMILAMLLAAGIGLAAVPGTSAAPVTDGAALNDIVAGVQPVEQVQHWRWGSRGGHWRWGSRGGHWRWGSRRPARLCHRPYSSRMWRCW